MHSSSTAYIKAMNGQRLFTSSLIGTRVGLVRFGDDACRWQHRPTGEQQHDGKPAGVS